MAAETSPRVYDAAVVGGGPVGQFFALAASRLGARVLLLESKAQQATLDDERTLALSWNSWLLLQRVGVTASLNAHKTPITTIHVSQSKQFGKSTLTAREAGIPVLGYVVSYSALQRALAQTLHGKIDAHYNTGVNDVRENAGHVSISCGDVTAHSRTVLIAEGGGPLLNALGFQSEEKQYGVNAVVALVSTDSAPDGTAYERFAERGPIALLPREDRYALVWTTAREASEQLIHASEEDFLQELQTTFGWRAGKFVSAAHRGQYPLVLKQVRDRTRGNIALLGNAAQTLHPVAGQGLNLGLRDAWAAAQSLKNVRQVPGVLLKNFSSARRVDREITIRFTDGLAEMFTKSWPGVGIVRALGLEALDISPLARRAFARAMSIGINL